MLNFPTAKVHTTLVSPIGFELLCLLMQVAERNIYDRMMCSSVSPESPTCPSNTPTLAQLTVSPPANHGSAHKKVRFREEDDYCDAPSAAEEPTESECTTHRDAGPSPLLRQKLISGEAAAAAPRATDTRLGGSPRALVPVRSALKRKTGLKSSMSYVPEHVRRPEAFTCYELDTPVVVGSGIDGTDDPLTAGPTSDQAMLGLSTGRVHSGMNKTSRTGSRRGVQGCLKQSSGAVGSSTSVEAATLRFAGLPEAECLRSSAVTAQQGNGLSGAGSEWGKEGVEEGIGEGLEPPEMVAFVPGKSSKTRARSGLRGASVALLQSTGSGDLEEQTGG
jgi:hypothetical protein